MVALPWNSTGVTALFSPIQGNNLKWSQKGKLSLWVALFWELIIGEGYGLDFRMSKYKVQTRFWIKVKESNKRLTLYNFDIDKWKCLFLFDFWGKSMAFLTKKDTKHQHNYKENQFGKK